MKIVEKINKKQQAPGGNEGVTIAFLGDSVTQGCFEIYTKHDGNVETIFEQDQAYHAKLRNILKMLYPCVPFNIINAGVSGDRAPGGLKRVERDVLRHDPDLVIVCFGLNDCGSGMDGIGDYISALEGIFKAVREHGAELIFMTPNTCADHLSDFVTDKMFTEWVKEINRIQNDGVLDAYIGAAKELCAKMGVTVCDCYAKWKKLRAAGVDTTNLLANYHNHPARDMHYLFAVSLLETILFDE